MRSISQPSSHFLSASSPISVSSSSGHGSASDTHTRPSSSSLCGSPSDGGFNSADEFCSSPAPPCGGDFRYFRARSSTPESLCGTPPVRERDRDRDRERIDDYRLMEYMAMDRYHLHYPHPHHPHPQYQHPHHPLQQQPQHQHHHDLHGGAHEPSRTKTFEEESSYMERAFLKLSLASKAKASLGAGFVHQKGTQTSSSSLDEASPVESSKHQPHPHPHPHPSASSGSGCYQKTTSEYKPYVEVSHHPQLQLHHTPKPAFQFTSDVRRKLYEDDGYMPMSFSPGSSAGSGSGSSQNTDYIPMLPRMLHPSTLDLQPCVPTSRPSPPQMPDTYMMMQPGGDTPPHHNRHHHHHHPPSSALPSPSSSSHAPPRTPPEFADYMDMSFSHATELYAQSPPPHPHNPPHAPPPPATPDTPKSHGSYFSLPRSYKTPLRDKMGPPPGPGDASAAQTPVDDDDYDDDDDPESPPSPGEYVHMDFGDRLGCPLVSSSPTSPPPPPTTVTAAFPPPASCEPHCAPLGQDYEGLGLDAMDALLFKGRPPRHSLVAPWNPPNYARPPSMSAYLQGQGQVGQVPDHLDVEKAFAQQGYRLAKSPSVGIYQHLCTGERPVQEDLQTGQGQGPGRRRHSSDTYSSSSTSSGRAVCTMKALASCSPPDGVGVGVGGGGSSKRWPNSVTCDRSPADDLLSPSSRPMPVPAATVLAGPCSGVGGTGGRGQPTSSTSYLNFGAFDLRDVTGDGGGGSGGMPSPCPCPEQAHSSEDEVYASMDYTVSGGSSATASKGWLCLCFPAFSKRRRKKSRKE